jgi:hypothetical protein
VGALGSLVVGERLWRVDVAKRQVLRNELLGQLELVTLGETSPSVLQVTPGQFW